MHRCCTDAHCTDVAALRASRQRPSGPADDSSNAFLASCLGTAKSLTSHGLQVHWLRVILDEGHMLGASLAITNKLQMACALRADRSSPSSSSLNSSLCIFCLLGCSLYLKDDVGICKRLQAHLALPAHW